LIKVEVSGRGCRLEFETDDPDEAVRRVISFVKEHFPEVSERMFGCQSPC